MARRIVILDSAKEEFKDIKSYVKKQFGDDVWNVVSQEYKQAIARIKTFPELGGHVDELRALGIENVKTVLVRQTRVLYEFDDDWVVIHMFIHTRRDFRSHLFKRFFNQ